MPVSERVQKRRAALRAAGLHPVQIWVPDGHPTPRLRR
ncbi:antitoxin MazE-like protein [Paracoccus nototheniae]|nr:antitoxin MazE-like protein [Paracoccus nototheniae]